MHIRPLNSLVQIFVMAMMVALMVGLPGCSDDPTEPEDTPTENLPTDIHVDQGQVGLVIDTRAIVKKGYTPQTVEVTFTDYPEIGATLDVDQTTYYAFLSYEVAGHEEGTITDLADGTGIQITINGPDKVVLAQYNDSVVIDNSNSPLVVETTLPFEPNPVVLDTDMAYLIQVQGSDYLFAWSETDAGNFDLDKPYTIDDPQELFYFSPVEGMESTFEWATDRNTWNRAYLCIDDWEAYDLFLDEDHGMDPWQFTMIPNEDGWVKFQDATTGEYLCQGEDIEGDLNTILLSDGEPLWFRLICDSIDWAVDDRGTIFNQPIMPPAQMDFAYRGELHNCASGELTDTIGLTEERTWEATSSTSEGLQLFSSSEQSLGVEINTSVSASIGATVPGIVEGSTTVGFSTNITINETFTTSSTTTAEQTWSNSNGGTRSVSHTREYVVPPYTAVLIRDAVKTVRNVRVPYTQTLRVTGTETETGRTLTGEEILSQMLFNFVGGVIQSVGESHVDIGLRGSTIIDQIFESTTYVDEIENVCN